VRVVLDSSVLIAAAISRAGVCAELLDEVMAHHELVLSEFILSELQRKLREKFRFPSNEVKQLARFLSGISTVGKPVRVPVGVCRDAEVLPILGTAIAGNAQWLITVDKDLLTLGTHQGTTIIKPGEFWRRSAE
jgi:uncharacterized protein